MPSMISRERGWLYIHPDRTGGSSVTTALCDLFDGRTWHKHARLWHFDIDPAKYFKFMTVRNPWDRCVSYSAWFAKHHQCNVGIERCIHAALPLCYFGLQEMDYVLRCEHMDQDFAGLCLKLNIEPREIRRSHQSDHAPYQEYFTEKTRQMVAERFAYEIERFGYTFDREEQV